jgi:HEAT repeat protein
LTIALWAALTFTVAAPTLAADQEDPRYVETRFHRVFLRNGNVLDGELIEQTPQSILLKLPRGEMSIRMESVDRVEFIKIKSLYEKPIIIPKLKDPVTPPKVPGKVPGGPGKMPPGAIQLDPQTEQEVQTLLGDYAAADVEKKSVIMNKLIQMGGQVPAYLVSVISRFERDQQPIVLTTLARSKDPALVPALGGLLEGAEPAIRLNVVMALGMLGSPTALPYIAPCLQDKDASVRSAAVTAFGLFASSPDAFDPLVPLLLDPDRDTRTRALAALNDIATKNSRKRDLGDALSSALDKAEGDVKVDLIFALGRGAHTTAWHTLASCLTDDSVAIRQAAAGALAELAVPDSGDAIANAVTSEKNSKVRVTLAKSVQKLGLLRTGGTLISWLGDSDQDAKEAARNTLSSLAGQNLGTDPEKWQAWWEKAKPQ